VVHFQDLWAEGGKGGKMARDSTRKGRDDSTRMNGNPLPFSMFAYIRRWVRVRLRAVPSQRHRERWLKRRLHWPESGSVRCGIWDVWS